VSDRAGGAPPRLDTLGMWDAAASLPQILRGAMSGARDAFGAHAWDIGAGEPVRSVAAFGLGSGGLAAQAAAAVAAPHLDLPLWLGTGADGADVPGFVGPETLAIALSCGDHGAETVAALTEALARGSRGIVVSDDGPLAGVAAEAGIPRAALATGGGPPDGAGGFAAALVAMLVVLARVGLSSDVASSVEAAADALARRHDVFASPGGHAERLARRIGRTIPIVYGAGALGGTAARWWKARINRNAKAPAFSAALPALTHDELAGWGQGGDVTRQTMTLVLLRQPGEPARTAALFDAVATATDEVMASVEEVWAEGTDDFGRLLDVALLGELVSLHLAAREGVDPGPVPAVDAATRASLDSLPGSGVDAVVEVDRAPGDPFRRQ
jgi:glucose/mannose-6-phosphate isomerase